MEQPPSASAEAVRVWDRPWVMYPLFVLIAAVGGLFGSFTLSANLLVLAVGGTLVWLGVTGRAGRRPTGDRLGSGVVWWLVPVGIFAAIELFTFAKKSIVDYPTLSLLADPLLEGYVPRAAAYFGWLVAFWGLVRR
jgi:hypothetical protein